MKQTVKNEKLENVVDTLLNKNLSPQMAEALFLELCFITPASDSFDEGELTVYPLDWFRNKSIYAELIETFSKVLNLSPFSLHQRFRAFLALMYLKGLRSDFRGYKKFLTSSRNNLAYKLASNLFDAEKFVRSFDDINSEAQIVSSSVSASF